MPALALTLAVARALVARTASLAGHRAPLALPILWLLGLLGPGSAEARPRILICYADQAPNVATQVATGINPGNQVFEKVDVLDCARGTPSLMTLKGYDGVLTWDDLPYADRVGLGDNLADYVDAGGGVVLAMFAFYTNFGQSYDLLGRFAAGKYNCINPGLQGAASLSLLPNDPQSPLVKDVKSLQPLNSGSGGLNQGAASLWDYSNGQPAIASCTPGGHLRVDLNFYPNPNNWKGDGFQILQNALVAVSGGLSPLKVSPSPALLPDTGVGSESAPFTLTFKNASLVDQVATGLAIAGPAGPEFALVRQPAYPVTVPAKGSFTVELRFAPAALGARSATLSVTLAPPQMGMNQPAPAQVTLVGQGVANSLTVKPSPVRFGGTASGAPIDLGVNVANLGGGRVQVNAITLGDPAFTITDGPPLPVLLGHGASFLLGLRFSPQKRGLTSANLAFTTTDLKNPKVNIPVSGSFGDPAISLDTGGLAFGGVNLTARSDALTITVTNAGFSDLRLGDLVLGGKDPGDFVVDRSGLPAVLAPQAAAPFTLAFAPTVEGSRSATATLASSDPRTPITTINLFGTGTSAKATVAPLAIDFGTQTVGRAGKPQDLVISTAGSGRLLVGSLTFLGPNAADFVQVAGTVAPFAIEPNTMTTLGIACKPSATGPLSGTAVVSTDVGMTSVGLSCAGVAPLLSVSPNQVDFGVVAVGRPSAAVPITFTNAGTAPLTLTSLTLAGGDQNDFNLPDLPGSPPVIPPGGMLVLNAIFTPSREAIEAAELDFTSDDPQRATGSLALNGSGARAGIAFSLSPVDFGNVIVGSASPPTAVAITNTGTLPVRVTSLSVNSPAFQLDRPVGPANEVVLPPLRSLTVHVTFSPEAAGAASAPLAVAMKGLVTTSTLLRGTGVSAFVALGIQGGGSRIDFGMVGVGQRSTPVEVLVKNNGPSPLTIDHIATSNPAFHVDTGGSSFMLAPQAVFPASLRYLPAAEQADTGRFQVFLAGVAAPAASVELAGVGVALSHRAGAGCSIGSVHDSVMDPVVDRSGTGAGMAPRTRSSSSGAGALATLVLLAAVLIRRRLKEVC